MDGSGEVKANGLSKLTEALVKAQAVMAFAIRDTDGQIGNQRYKYATLANIWDVCRKPLTENGLAVVQQAEANTEGITITTRLLHVSGEEVSTKLWLPCPVKTPQGYGSAITYGRRYSLGAIIGVVTDADDDGAAASAGTVTPPAPKGVEAVKAAARPAEVRATRPPEADPRPEPPAQQQLGGKQRTHQDISLKSHGKMIRISEMADKDLEYWAARKRESVADPVKARFHQSDSHDLACIDAELRFRNEG